MSEFRIVHEASKDAAVAAVREIPLDGSKIVKIVGSGSKTARQRNYMWLLFRAIEKAGKGDADTAFKLDLINKYRFRHIWFAEHERRADTFAYTVRNYPDEIQDAVAEQLHTELLSRKQMAEYLDSIIKHYGKHVDLPHPEDWRE